MIFSLIIGILLLGGIFYFQLPVFNIHFFSFHIFLNILITIIILFILILTKSKKNIKLLERICYIFPVFIILSLITIGVKSAPIFNSRKYQSLLPKPTYKNFSKEVKYIDDKNIRTVNSTYARLLADKKLGEEPSLGSKVEIGHLTIQNINGKLYYVAPLEHSSFIKWFTNRTTPGYIMVSATDDKDVKLIKDKEIKYSPYNFFNSDLKRHIYFNGIKTQGLTDFTFELDNDLTPYWTASIYDNTIGVKGKVVKGIATINANTGEVKKYNISNAPKWIDRIQPCNLCMDNLNNWGELVNGYFNFSGKDKLTSSPGCGVVYNDGHCYYYTGLTSVGTDNSTVGFALIDTRTQETTIFKISGATENAAISSAEGKVQNLKYTGTFPILLNIENIPTYFITLNDNNGLTKLYAMVSVKDYNIVGLGESVTECKSNYIKLIQSKSNNDLINSNGKMNILKGHINRIGSFILDKYTYYNFTLKEQPNKIFTIAQNISDTLPITKENDFVEFQFNETKSNTINCLQFKNLNINK